MYVCVLRYRLYDIYIYVIYRHKDGYTFDEFINTNLKVKPQPPSLQGNIGTGGSEQPKKKKPRRNRARFDRVMVRNTQLRLQSMTVVCTYIFNSSFLGYTQRHTLSSQARYPGVYYVLYIRIHYLFTLLMTCIYIDCQGAVPSQWPVSVVFRSLRGQGLFWTC